MEPAKELDELTSQVIGAAIKVHRYLGRDILRAFMKRRFRLSLERVDSHSHGSILSELITKGSR